MNKDWLTLYFRTRFSRQSYTAQEGATGDPYFVYAVAKANAIGNLKEAENALRLIAAKRPDVRRDADFKAAVDFVTLRMPPH